MDRLYQGSIYEKIGNKKRTLILVSYLLLCAYGVLYLVGDFLGIRENVIPILRFGSAILAFVALIHGGKLLIRNNNYTLWYLGIILVSFASCIYSIDSNAISTSVNILKTGIIAIAFYTTLRDEKCIKQFLFMTALTGVIVFYILSTHYVLYIDKRLGTTLTSGHTNSFAEFIMVSLIAAIMTLVLSKRNYVKVIMAISIVLETYLLLLSGGRKYIICPIVMIVVYALNKNKSISSTKRILLFLALIIGIYGLWHLMMSNEIIYNSIGIRFESESTKSGASDRLTLVLNGFKFFVRSPIFGHGENAYNQLNYSSFGDFRYSHNNYVELLTNFGIIGFLVYYVPFFMVIVKLKRLLSKDSSNDYINLFFSFMIGVLFLQTGTITYTDVSLLIQLIAISFMVADYYGYSFSQEVQQDN